MTNLILLFSAGLPVLLISPPVLTVAGNLRWPCSVSWFLHQYPFGGARSSSGLSMLEARRQRFRNSVTGSSTFLHEANDAAGAERGEAGRAGDCKSCNVCRVVSCVVVVCVVLCGLRASSVVFELKSSGKSARNLHMTLAKTREVQKTKDKSSEESQRQQELESASLTCATTRSKHRVLRHSAHSRYSQLHLQSSQGQRGSFHVDTIEQQTPPLGDLHMLWHSLLHARPLSFPPPSSSIPSSSSLSHTCRRMRIHTHRDHPICRELAPSKLLLVDFAHAVALYVVHDLDRSGHVVRRYTLPSPPQKPPPPSPAPTSMHRRQVWQFLHMHICDL